MLENALSKAPLTKEQVELVRANLGLIAVHLQRNVRNLRHPHRDCEWDDLFQEGCLGLIQAAISFQPDCGIPFAAWALPRIHQAVSRGLQTRFSTVYVPPQRARRKTRNPIDERSTGASRRPSVRSFPTKPDALQDRRLDRHRCDAFDEPGPSTLRGETLHERVRAKYDRALQKTVRSISEGHSRRGDRDELVQLLAEERYSIPTDDLRRPLRQIARDTQSSYARVMQTDRQMVQRIRGLLGSDPEFDELYDRLRKHPGGESVAIGDELETLLISVSAGAFLRRLRGADSAEAARMLHDLLTRSRADFERIVHEQMKVLSPDQREELISPPGGNKLEPAR